MPWAPCPDDHAWVHIDGWAGRYRCDRCHIIGYKGFVTGIYGRTNPKNSQVIPYRCPKCHGPTTKFHYKRPGEYRIQHGAQPCPSCAVGA